MVTRRLGEMAWFFAVDRLQTELAAVITDSGPVLRGPKLGGAPGAKVPLSRVDAAHR
jgi:hypothetical protein